MSTIRKAGMGLLAGVVFSLGSPSAGRADHDHFRDRRQTADVDIEGLRAQLRFERGQWLLSVSYRIEAENLNRASRLALVMKLENGGSCGAEPIVVPLRVPRGRGRDELVFQDTITRALPSHVVGNPNRMRLQVSVVADGGRVLEEEDTRVSIRKPVGDCGEFGSELVGSVNWREQRGGRTLRR